jgi:hypothetical protein
VILGERFYCLWYHHGASARRRRRVDKAEWTKSRMVGFMGHHVMGESHLLFILRLYTKLRSTKGIGKCEISEVNSVAKNGQISEHVH